ncbi:hypothetical protein [Streptomyces sp. SYSU K217416]
MSRSQIHHEPIEQRLRDALEVRAYAVDLNDLRPADPPTRPGRSVRPGRRTAAVLFGLAAAVASILLAFTERHPDTPVSPAVPPSLSPSPSPPPPSPAGPSPAAPTGTTKPPGAPSLAHPAGELTAKSAREEG